MRADEGLPELPECRYLMLIAREPRQPATDMLAAQVSEVFGGTAEACSTTAIRPGDHRMKKAELTPTADIERMHEPFRAAGRGWRSLARVLGFERQAT